MPVAIISEGRAQRAVRFTPPMRLSSLLLSHHAPLALPCGEQGRCAKCRVMAYGALSDFDPAELTHLTETERARGMRLACRCQVTGDCSISIPQTETAANILSDGRSLRRYEPDDSGPALVCDIGTTTVVCQLIDRATGQPLAVERALNAQAPFGADVMTRLGASRDGRRAELQQAITAQLNGMMDRLGRTADISAATITGNTAMLTLLCGDDAAPLCAAPFTPPTLYGTSRPASALLGRDDLCFDIYLPRCISAFVGADVSCGLLSTGMTGTALLIDIGTNGEMVLMHNHRRVGTSTAAGPCFEGALIEHGMAAATGAIDSVRVHSGALTFTTIGGAAPRGLCGSGLIDAVAALLSLGVIDETGALDETADGVVSHNDRPAYRLAGDVLLTQADIRMVQLAKSAICSGVETLLHTHGLTPDDVGALYLAGGFGTALNLDAAARIGLIPPALRPRTVVLGNAALAGAALTQVSRQAQRDLEILAAATTAIDLSTSPYFGDRYIENMLFA